MCLRLLRSARESFCTNTSLLYSTKAAKREEHSHQETGTRLRKVVWWVLKNLMEQGKKFATLQLGMMEHLFHTATCYIGQSSFTRSFML